nr:tetratricopeptide repeat protein [Acidobacteriota bacterium]
PPYERTIETLFDTGDAVPMAVQHAESPFEEPSGYTAAALEIEQPEGMHIEEAPLVAEMPAPSSEERSEEHSEERSKERSEERSDVTATTTMADLYVRQGLIDDARKIYEHVLQRDPSDDEVRAKLDALSEPQRSVPEERFAEEKPEPLAGNPKVVVLQQWLAKVGRREEGGA